MPAPILRAILSVRQRNRLAPPVKAGEMLEATNVKNAFLKGTGGFSRPRSGRFNIARPSAKRLGALRRGGSVFWEKKAVARRERELARTMEENEGTTAKEETKSVLPTTEEEMLHLLYKLRRNNPPLAATRLVEIHSHPTLAPFVSQSSYAYLLRLSYRISNLALARQLLDEMKERHISSGKEVCLAMLYGYTKRGDMAGAVGMRTVLRENGWEDETGTGEDFWRERRDLGKEQGKGMGDSWKTWGRRGWGSAKMLAEAGIAKEKELSNGLVTRATPGVPIRPDVVVPLHVGALSGQTIIRLVDSLVHERRTSEAFDVAETWLDMNRPKRPSLPFPSTTAAATQQDNFALNPRPAIEYAPAPIYLHLRRPGSARSLTATSFSDPIHRRAVSLYNSRALILLNILLKSLLMHYVPPFGARSFVVEFIDRHSVPNDLHIGNIDGIRPDIVTLRELLMNLRSRKNGWRKGIETINWYNNEFGGLPGESVSSFRRRFKPVSNYSPSVSRSTSITNLLSFFPTSHATALALAALPPPASRINFRLALLILNYAVVHQKTLTRNSESIAMHAIEVKAWWESLDVKGDKEWDSRLAGDIFKKAVRCGVLEGKHVKRPNAMRRIVIGAQSV